MFESLTRGVKKVKKEELNLSRRDSDLVIDLVKLER